MVVATPLSRVSNIELWKYASTIFAATKYAASKKTNIRQIEQPPQWSPMIEIWVIGHKRLPYWRLVPQFDSLSENHIHSSPFITSNSILNTLNIWIHCTLSLHWLSLMEVWWFLGLYSVTANGHFGLVAVILWWGIIDD